MFRAAAFSVATFFAACASWAQSVPNTVVLAQAQDTPAAAVVSASAPTPSAEQQDASQVKRWSFYWGWNRSNYSESDIHFTGSDHDFTLKHVKASDLQTDTSHLLDVYLNPGQITIPQTNARLAYQWDKDTAVALNLDHMKYVMIQDQSVPIEGQINGTTQSGEQVLRDDWLNYEHTDGLNIITLELEQQYPVNWFGDSNSSRVFALVGLGIVLPKTNATMHMIGQSRNDEFHLAGYSADVGAGFEQDFWKDYFFRTAYKYGYVNLPDVLTSARGDKASQHFTYNELLIAFGMRF